jgi:hypothetical protein
LLELVWINLVNGEEKEKKRASLGCPRVGKHNRTCTLRAALPGGWHRHF